MLRGGRLTTPLEVPLQNSALKELVFDNMTVTEAWLRGLSKFATHLTELLLNECYDEAEDDVILPISSLR